MSNQLVTGTLYVKPLNAEITHSTDMFFKMDPYCLFINGQNKKKSTTCQNGGKKPSWNDTVAIEITNQEKLFVEIWDEENMGKNKLIAVGEIDLNKMIQ
mmetsp:Transcript_16213/g.13789  ORF Transcript_16213/g.13789 Transcript_16213/m.13789 type:complete len:99 (+) Transcript_16213:143-439(+)|eukprot:CAMPEP_0114588126 /NCGR_PEP_ID=MMETSP0125-20121206/10911_1 /TAXON_ID=485358 ORGANISM="Aristerostoma sp., Strain ATCC 50986" /NCGR_SAMPLE_ID=MMETSP0125 /ASSEMBLY_ACC=CAM_ASM_000245 /LENGTH=98 /DNA_ID=CAMNT_0001784375 /DNA_START=82 /DNA_END=378 /DNA_ORIENTATION=-